jgi:hypothetical protein
VVHQAGYARRYRLVEATTIRAIAIETGTLRGLFSELFLCGAATISIERPDEADQMHRLRQADSRSFSLVLGGHVQIQTEGALEMGGSDSWKVSSSGLKPETSPPRIIECSSPPCMLHELDPKSMEHSERPPATSATQNWDEVRLWRKAKRTVLIERRVAMSATERPRAARRLGRP